MRALEKLSFFRREAGGGHSLPASAALQQLFIFNDIITRVPRASMVSSRAALSVANSRDCDLFLCACVRGYHGLLNSIKAMATFLPSPISADSIFRRARGFLNTPRFSRSNESANSTGHLLFLLFFLLFLIIGETIASEANFLFS